ESLTLLSVAGPVRSAVLTAPIAASGAEGAAAPAAAAPGDMELRGEAADEPSVDATGPVGPFEAAGAAASGDAGGGGGALRIGSGGYAPGSAEATAVSSPWRTFTSSVSLNPLSV